MDELRRDAVEENKFRIRIDPQALVPNESVRKYYWWSVLVTMMLAAGIVVLWRYLPQTVPLFFTEPWGEARLAPKIYLFLLPIISLTVTTVNVLVGKAVTSEHKVLVYALATGSLGVSVILLVALYGIAQSLL